MKSILLTLSAAISAQAFGFHGLHPRQSNWTVGQTVQTSSGAVAGHPAANATQVSEYLGIPFGLPPTGDLRFAAPIAYTGNASINGSAFGNSCPVKPSSSAAGLPPASVLAAANVTATNLEVLENSDTPSGATFSEDCLFLNVWTKPQVGEQKKAVLVWIYGGSFSSGSTTVPIYNGANIADQEDVIVVSLNYRINVLGFPGSPTTPNNLGLLDQRLAVEWVRDNIAAFGGDTARITLFGQSAGSASVDLYSYAWANDSIVAGFIGESGTVLSFGIPNSQASANAGWYNVSTSVGCGNASTSTPENVLACMRQLPVETLLAGIPSGSAASGIQQGGLGPFIPTVDNVVVFANYSAMSPAPLPFLLGNNDYEAGLFQAELALASDFVPESFWIDFDLLEFTCPAGIRANMSLAAKVPTWRYRYFGDFPDDAVSTSSGAYHGSEIALIFNTQIPVPAPSAEEVALGNYMRGAWAAFAKNPTSGLTSYGWPMYDPSMDTLIRLGYNNTVGVNTINPKRYDADCIFINAQSSNGSSYPTLPDLGATITPTGTVVVQTGMPTSTGGSTGSGTVTGTPTSSPSATTASAGDRVEVRVWFGLSAAILGMLFGI